MVGYSDRLTVRPGERLRLMVSCEAPTYRSAIVRLVGIGSGTGPAKELVVRADLEHPGRRQTIAHGSYVHVPHSPLMCLQEGFSLTAWIYPTTPGRGLQGVLTKGSGVCAGYGLFISEDGDLALRIGDGHGDVVEVCTGKALRPFSWYFVSAEYNAGNGRVSLRQEPVPGWPLDGTAARVEKRVVVQLATTDAPFLIGADWDGKRARGHFNGKIDRPRLAGVRSLVAAWDLSKDISGRSVVDTSGNGLHGETVNMPLRAVTGHNWSGDEPNWGLAPSEYGAIFFHEDDLDDARWDVDFEFVVPRDAQSGVYAARLRAANDEFYVPFFVRPRKGTSSQPLAFIAPTLSYLAYATGEAGDAGSTLLSLYDEHVDGTTCYYASRLRPLNLLPAGGDERMPHQLAADLCLIEWLEAKGYGYDVLTDEDVHAEGSELLERYRVVLTGHHPEYTTRAMLDALAAYLVQGGRLMYLGGNGFYWVTSIDPERPHVVEVRRGQRGTARRPSATGEGYHSTTGEIGGLWRDRGKPPQKLVGVGMTAQGVVGGRPYRREPGSFDPRSSFIFDGVSADKPIGDAGAIMGAAAGWEIDRFDYSLGTPPHALLLATSTDFSDSYQHVVEEVKVSDSMQGGTVNPLVRSDVVFFETPLGGGVFSVGSMTWCGSLMHDDGDTDVSRITENVLRRFLS